MELHNVLHRLHQRVCKALLLRTDGRFWSWRQCRHNGPFTQSYITVRQSSSKIEHQTPGRGLNLTVEIRKLGRTITLRYRGTKAASNRNVGCPERQMLARAVADALEEMKQITGQLIPAVHSGSSRLVNELYSKLGKVEREHERRMRELREHESHHECTGVRQSPKAGQVEPEGARD